MPIQEQNASFLNIQHAVHTLKQGGIIAYPTEAVYGLGCLATNLESIKKILQLKQRPIEKGLILLASEWSQLTPYISPLEDNILKKIQASWPGPFTWIVPTPDKTSTLIKGKFSTIAVRISAHPIVQQLCQLCDSAIISTSANITGKEMSYTAHDVQQHFQEQLDYILGAPLGQSKHPSTITNALTDQVIRP